MRYKISKLIFKKYNHTWDQSNSNSLKCGLSILDFEGFCVQIWKFDAAILFNNENVGCEFQQVRYMQLMLGQPPALTRPSVRHIGEGPRDMNSLRCSRLGKNCSLGKHTSICIHQPLQQAYRLGLCGQIRFPRCSQTYWVPEVEGMKLSSFIIFYILTLLW